MHFTVVVPSHKRKKLLSNLLTSLTEQSLGKNEFEVIVVATENDEAFELESNNWDLNINFCFVPNDPTHGRSASAKRNYGVSLAKAEWIAFVDDDCITGQDWLAKAKEYSLSTNLHYMEGEVIIPVPKIKNFVYKGIKRLSKPGGFQTCNMFYKRQDFLDHGGFDPNFPYYLEDTDMGWTFKEAGKEYTYAKGAIVEHPVPDPVPKKMLESAFRMEKLPYLFKKHPKTFKESKIRVLPRPYTVLAAIDLIILYYMFVNLKFAILFLALKLGLSLILLLRMLRGCQWTAGEFWGMYFYLQICPLISLIWLIKDNIQQKTWIFLK